MKPPRQSTRPARLERSDKAADLAAAGLDGPRPDDCPSIHWLGDQGFAPWFGLIRTVLAANTQTAAAQAA